MILARVSRKGNWTIALSARLRPEALQRKVATGRQS